jgi:Transposase protein
MGATNTLGRLACSLGKLGPAEPRFESSLDVPNGGVLFGLPALLSVGLLRHADKFFKLPNGYYGLPTIFLLLAFMALARLKFAENLRYIAPGEWGKLLGLDRIPEVKILREKVAILTQNGISKQWNAELCKDWMNESPEEANTLYIDGHVRVYHGSQAKLPKHYVSRDKLCARATIDYWVNAMDGKPFFLISKPVDPGLIKTLEYDIVPRLEKDIPNQPTEVELENNPLLHRFVLVFDREGYSPEFMIKMKRNRIACITYNKNPGEDWPLEEFTMRKIKLQSGEEVEYKMAERGVFKPLRNCSVEETKKILGENYNKKRKGLWVREIRKLKENGQQGSIIATDYINKLETISVNIFARWSQENFFGYMMKHYGLDRVIDYGLEKLDDTTKVLNPEYRKTDSDIRRLNSKLVKNKAKFAGISLEAEIGSKDFEEKQKLKSEILEEINGINNEILEKKKHRKSLKKHIQISELPDDLKFDVLNSKSKYFIDTIKMIAYRAETATVNILKEEMTSYAKDEARSLMRAIFESSADLLVNEEKQTLTVKLHNLANHSSDKLVRYLCEELNSLEMKYPGTNLQLIYKLISDSSDSTMGSDSVNEAMIHTRLEKVGEVEMTTNEEPVMNSVLESQKERFIAQKKDQIITPDQLSFW